MGRKKEEPSVRRQVVLVGNGINRVDNDYAWEDLMGELLEFTGLSGAVSTRNKPFPMIYEEMYLRWMKEGKGERKELTLKKMIQRLLRNIQSNDLHNKIVDLPADDLMTTNFDYNLEATLPNGLQDANMPCSGAGRSVKIKSSGTFTGKPRSPDPFCSAMSPTPATSPGSSIT